MPNDDTIPQNTEGDQYMTQAITPNSAANILRVIHQGQYTNSAGAYNEAALFQDSTANALCSLYSTNVTADYPVWAQLGYLLLAAGTSATTFKIRTGPSSASTITFNGLGGARKHGGVLNSYLQVEEIMG